MADLFATGRIVDLILLLVGLLAVGLAIRLGRRAKPILIGLLPGIALMLALRAALVGAHWHLTATALTAALVTYLLDLRERLRAA